MRTSHPYGLRHWAQSLPICVPPLTTLSPRKPSVPGSCSNVGSHEYRVNARTDLWLSSHSKAKKATPNPRDSRPRRITEKRHCLRYVEGWDSVQSGLVDLNQPQNGLAVPAKIIQRHAPHRSPHRREACSNSPAPVCALPPSTQSGASSCWPFVDTIS